MVLYHIAAFFARVSRTRHKALASAGASVALTSSALQAGCEEETAQAACCLQAGCEEETAQVSEQHGELLRQCFASAAVGASVLASAAPALCAVHCAAMPAITVLLPTL